MSNKTQKTPLLFKIPKTEAVSFNVQLEVGEGFYPTLHYHPELQITHIRKGRGACFIGETVGHFSPGDVFIIGPNTPHFFRNDAGLLNTETGPVTTLSIYFNKEAFGDRLFSLPETMAIAGLIERSGYGIIVDKQHRHEVADRMERIRVSDGFDRLIELFVLLNMLATGYRLRTISKHLLTASTNDRENQRLNDVFDFMIQNYHKPLTLEEGARVANMSQTAFCRYFVKRTRKTYTGFLNEIRIGYACNKLLTTDKSISEIAYECGYKNISHFNRQFQKIVAQTPSEYKAIQSILIKQAD
jgi:AraC-like DNA-binding protein/quercetin dioxygenase-like cupin family protein